MYYYNNELYHYGVKGMKWGVRRYQPYGTGGYNPFKNRKMIRAQRKEAKQIRNKISNASINYDDEFDNTKEGKKLRKAYLDVIEEMENSIYDDDGDDMDAWWSKNSDRFLKTEEAYLKPQAKYTANKLLQNYSHSDIYYYLRESNRQVTEDMDADQYRKILIDMWKNNRYD